ncbi:hypothetical protein NEF87_004009 [Candidatus Lokiarchaeum ossiferum]|uniref:Cdc6 C-terminal domain-containing protein n=1 Tax=Candidatus Lokiarchaeum ossiferum TaxID=2951803 RepID=A0ABY6HW33_9ARCH|nr:hypothetical protein NEF87_004009 [Candidatus Lokiarchaeum sp. B-35]
MAKKTKLWQPIPLEKEIVQLLLTNRGEILTSDLYRQLANKYQDFAKSEMMEALFKLEVRSYVHVIPIKKDVSKVEISRNARFTDEIKNEVRKFMH